MSDKQLLLLEDEPDQRLLLSAMLREAGYQVTACANVAEARAALPKQAFAFVLSDWKLGADDGLAFLKETQSLAPHSACILMTAYGSIPHAVQSLREGLDDYLCKPFDRSQLLFALAKLESRAPASAAEDGGEALEGLIGQTPAMRTVSARLRKIANTRVTVLITGESGTGKEVAARALHQLSARQAAPFVALNCAALPETLFEAELFGAEKGAYTGADKQKIGRIEAAEGGSLFLDEMGDLPLSLQAKLLRVLQEGVFNRLGSSKELRADVRIIAATHRDLQADVQSGRFRADLFYRLQVVPVRMPSLRERRDDIPLLIEHFLQQSATRHGVEAPQLLAATVRTLREREWPGNVRELGHAIERLTVLAAGARIAPADLRDLLDDDLPLDATTDNGNFSGEFVLPESGLDWESHEREVLLQALQRANGNRAKAARLLNLNYKAFLYRLEKHGLDKSAQESEA